MNEQDIKTYSTYCEKIQYFNVILWNSNYEVM